MTEQQLTELGFEFGRGYDHDQFHTKEYRKGILMVQLTYEKDQLLTADLIIDEPFEEPVTLNELKAITPILAPDQQS